MSGSATEAPRDEWSPAEEAGKKPNPKGTSYKKSDLKVLESFKVYKSFKVFWLSGWKSNGRTFRPSDREGPKESNFLRIKVPKVCKDSSGCKSWESSSSLEIFWTLWESLVPRVPTNILVVFIRASFHLKASKTFRTLQLQAHECHPGVNRHQPGPPPSQLLMFIPDTLRSCMVEPDVSTYLQAPSVGQVLTA